MTRRRKLFWIAIVCINATSFSVLGITLHQRLEMRRALAAAETECRTAAPEVDYHPGMTLCPGQSARVRALVPIPDNEAPAEQAPVHAHPM